MSYHSGLSCLMFHRLLPKEIWMVWLWKTLWMILRKEVKYGWDRDWFLRIADMGPTERWTMRVMKLRYGSNLAPRRRQLCLETTLLAIMFTKYFFSSIVSCLVFQCWTFFFWSFFIWNICYCLLWFRFRPNKRAILLIYWGYWFMDFNYMLFK